MLCRPEAAALLFLFPFREQDERLIKVKPPPPEIENKESLEDLVYMLYRASVIKFKIIF